jgi:hypothetical protein
MFKVSNIYKALRIRNDINAIKKKKVGKRIGRRISGSIMQRIFNKLFR